MNKAMYAAASGMALEQAKLDVIAGNLANADAVGFKGSTMDFAELTDGGQTVGATARGSHIMFAQGKLMKSGGAFDIALDGEGFFAVNARNGVTAFTRDGRFTRATDGTLRTADGNTLPGVKLAPDATKISVDKSGGVFADVKAGAHVQVGKISIAIFSAPQALRSVGGTTFEPTQASGGPQFVVPGSRGSGSIAFGMLEKSNVSIMEEMMEILSAQRAFEANAKGVQAADEIQRIANSISRS